MTGFLVRRLLNYLVLCLVAAFLAFALASVTFEPLAKLQGQNPPPSAAAVEAKRQELGLNEPVPQRFVGWLGGVMQGDFGTTITGVEITDELVTRLGVTLRLLLIGTVVGVVVGVLVGVASAIRQYRFGDYAVTVFSFVVLSVRFS